MEKWIKANFDSVKVGDQVKLAEDGDVISLVVSRSKDTITITCMDKYFVLLKSVNDVFVKTETGTQLRDVKAFFVVDIDGRDAIVLFHGKNGKVLVSIGEEDVLMYPDVLCTVKSTERKINYMNYHPERE